MFLAIAGLRIPFRIKAEDLSTEPGIHVLVGKAVAVFRVVSVGQQQDQQQQALDWTRPWVESCFGPLHAAEVIAAIEEGKELQSVEVSMRNGCGILSQLSADLHLDTLCLLGQVTAAHKNSSSSS
jgi:hypothetical protein